MTKRSNLILLDPMLPSVDGFEVLQKIRRFADSEILKVQIVVLPNFYEMKDITKAQKYGIAHSQIKSQADMELVSIIINEILG